MVPLGRELKKGFYFEEVQRIKIPEPAQTRKWGHRFLEAGSIGDEFTRHNNKYVLCSRSQSRGTAVQGLRHRWPHLVVLLWELLRLNHHEDRNSLCLIRRSIGVCISSAQVCGVRSRIIFLIPDGTAGEMDARRWMKIEVVNGAIKVDISFIIRRCARDGKANNSLSVLHTDWRRRHDYRCHTRYFYMRGRRDLLLICPQYYYFRPI